MATRLFAGGTVTLQDDTISEKDVQYVRVRFLGFECLEESDELSSSDEPYFFIGVVGSNGSTLTRFGPYENVDAGESRLEAVEVASHPNHLTPPIILGGDRSGA